MSWPEGYVFCDQSGLEAPNVDKADCPDCGQRYPIGGTPSDPRWPWHSYRLSTAS